MSEPTNEAPVAPEATEVVQTAPAVEATTTEAGQAAGAVAQEQGIVVGNQTFKTQDELAKAYAESQRGYTQATQKHAKELEAYKATAEWLQGLKRDPQKWDRFIKFVNSKGEEVPQGTPGAVPVQATPVQPGDPNAQFRADIEGRLEAQNAQLEYLGFRHTHQNLDDATVGRVIDQVDKWLDEGKDRTMEEAYRWIVAEEKLAGALRKMFAGAELPIEVVHISPTPIP